MRDLWHGKIYRQMKQDFYKLQLKNRKSVLKKCSLLTSDNKNKIYIDLDKLISDFNFWKIHNEIQLHIIKEFEENEQDIERVRNMFNSDTIK